jgi:glycerol-3-phosphate acyltransferase PlsY
VQILSYVIVVIGAYLLGSLPTGFLVGKSRGVDIRTVGSKNMGATNVFRVLGTVPGIFVLVIDGLKGFAACTWMIDLLLNVIPAPSDLELLRIIAGIAAVLGHNYTCWLWFKGGKGIATTAGVYFALAPWAVTIAICVFVVAVLLTRYVSVGSIAAAIALPIPVWLGKWKSDSLTLQLVTTALCIMAIVNHKKNILRLMNGTESRIGKKSAPAPEAAK